MDSERRLYRPASGRMIGGVAAGLGSYFGMDIAIARIIWGVLLLAGVGLPIYLLCWIAMPREPLYTIDGFFEEPVRRPSTIRTLAKIAALLIVGAFVASNISEEFTVVAFIVGLAIGLYFLLKNRAQDDDADALAPKVASLYRSETNRKILGVFGGLADTLGVDPTLLRIVGGIVVIAGFPVIVPLYLLYAFIVPARRVITL